MFEPVKDDLGIRPDGTELISGRLGVPGRGARLYCRRWTRPGGRRGTIAIVPGFSDHGARYSKLTSAALDRGWDVSALDTRGHGRSEGRRGHVKRFADYYDDVNVWLGWLTGQGEGATHQGTREPVVLWGHSMGGLIALGYLTAGFGPGVGVDACVVTSPSLTVVSPIPKWKDFIGRGLSRYAPWIHMASEIDTSHLTRDAEVCTAYERDPLVHGVCTPRLYTEMLGIGRKLREAPIDLGVPLVLAHGEDDRIAGIDGTREYFDRSLTQSKGLLTYPDARHELHNETNVHEFIEDVFAHLGDTLGANESTTEGAGASAA